MDRKKRIDPRGFSMLAAVLLAGILAPAGPAAAQPAPEAGAVYYQVTYADGTVRDLNEVPETSTGIRRVMRVGYLESPFKGYEVLTTEPPVLRLVHSPRVARDELTWSGKAWVAPALQRPAAPPGEQAAAPDPIAAEIGNTRRILAVLGERLKAHDHAVGQAERELAGRKGADSQPAAREALEEARRRRAATLEAIRQYERQLDALNDAAGQEGFPRPTGRVEGLAEPPSEGQMGIVHPTAERAVLPHRVQVWPLPVGEGPRRYTVAMAHPEAGRFGAFLYVAYADTDADGLPDELIARSPPAAAEAPGRWTRWDFSTSAPAVFVGNAWWDEAAGAYCRRTPPRPGEWRGLGTDVYVAPVPGVVPRRRWSYWPYLSNIRVHVDQNPDACTPSGPEIIVR